MSYVARRSAGAAGRPVVFTFHGTGGSENQFHGLAEELVPGAQIVSPRGDVSEMGAARFFRRTGEGVYDMDDLRARTGSMARFVAAERAAADAPSEIIAIGYSNGANIAASVSFAAPESFDRLVLLHPLIPFEPDPQPGLAGRRVLITAGQSDPICAPGYTRALEAYFRAQGAEVTIAWHPGGHEIRQDEIVALRAFLAAGAA